MPANFSAQTQGSTTFVALAGTGCTSVNGVTVASVDVVWGIEYNHGVCPYAASSGGNQSTCDYMVLAPHQCVGNPSLCYGIIYDHGGGGYSGTNGENGDASAGLCPTGGATGIVQCLQQLVGRPTPTGGNLTAFLLPNYRLTGNGGVPVNGVTFPANWQDAKCALWHALANPSTFPVSHTIMGSYGGSWGAFMTFERTLVPDNAYTASCDSSPPSVEPFFFSEMDWPVTTAVAPNGDSGIDNTQLTCALMNSWIVQLMFSSDSPTSCSLANAATERTRCAAFGAHGCDPFSNIVAGNAATVTNVKARFGYGSPGTTCGNTTTNGPDCLTCPYWNDGKSSCGTGTTGGSEGGQLYTLAAAYASAGLPMPTMDIYYSHAGKYGALMCHECDLSDGNSGVLGNLPISVLMAFNHLLNTRCQAAPARSAGRV